MQQARALYRQGQWSHAQTICRDILAVKPDELDALILSGIIAGQTNDFSKAVQFFDKAIALDRGNAAIYCNRGLALQGLEQFHTALESYDHAIRLRPDYAIAYCNRGNVLKELALMPEALASYDRAIALNPMFAEACNNRAVLLQGMRRLEAALAGYDRAIGIRPNYAEAHYNRANLLKELCEPEAALASYDRAIAVNPGYAEALLNRGVLLAELKRPEEAIVCYDRAIAAKAGYLEAYLERATACNELARWQQALESCELALACDANNPEIHLRRARALHGLGKFEAALRNYDKVISIKPDHVAAHSNRGNVLQDLGQFEAALSSFDKAIAISPDMPVPRFNKGMTLLLSGDFENGWLHYEWRPSGRHGESSSNPGKTFAQPLWLGAEQLAGKTIFLHDEQGLGDTLQFCRYVPMVAGLGARVVLAVQSPLIGLLSTLEGVAELVVSGDSSPAFDLHCPLPSLPLAFKTSLETIPASIPYLKADPVLIAHWETRLGDKTRPRIGLAWSGNPDPRTNLYRSIELRELLAHLPSGFQYCSLQKDVRDRDRQDLETSAEILDFGDQLRDFRDTAALCACMDAVISVDTSVAHLAGALGKETKILLPFNSDWRWLVSRSDSPWYPTANLYRQRVLGEWPEVLERVKADLVRQF